MRQSISYDQAILWITTRFPEEDPIHPSVLVRMSCVSLVADTFDVSRAHVIQDVMAWSKAWRPTA